MTQDHATNQPRYASLRDYLRVLRDYGVMIVLLTVVGGAAAAGYSLQQDSIYQATATVSFQDESRDFGIFGLAPSPPEPAGQVASAKSTIVTRADVIERALKELDTDLSAGALSASIQTVVEPGSALVSVTGQAGEPEFAAALTNAVAAAAVKASNRETRARFQGAVRDLREQTEGELSRLEDPNAELFQRAEIARLSSVSDFLRSAELIRPAAVPGAPASPKPVRSALLGAIAGLLVALLISFFRDSLDRRLRSAHEIEDQFQLPVIGHIRDEAMGKTAYAHTGSNGSSSEDAQGDLEAFRILRRNLELVDPTARSIVVTSGFPAEGKTTVSSSLAFMMAVAGRRTLLLEADLRRPVLAERLGVERAPGLSDFLAGRATPQEVMRVIEFTDPIGVNGSKPNGDGSTPNGHSPGGLTYSLVCIPAGSATPRADELLGSNRLKELLATVEQAYDVVIIDSSPLLPVADTLELLPHADAILVCARELQTTREQARAARDTLARFPRQPLGIVVTGTRPTNAEYEGYTYSSAYPLAD